MAKSSKYEIDWSKLPEVTERREGSWGSGEWWFGLEDLEAPLDQLEHAVYANLAWYLFVKEQRSGGAKA
jgi:hypothetical protein